MAQKIINRQAAKGVVLRLGPSGVEILMHRILSAGNAEKANEKLAIPGGSWTKGKLTKMP